jgi:hypothetical protein
MRAMNADEIIIADAVKDIPLSYLGEFARLLFERIYQEVLARPKLSAKERNWFEGEVQTFDEHFKKILANNDKQQQDVALRAVASALCLSFYHAGGPQNLREIIGEFQNKWTKPAHLGRSRPDIQEITERQARALRNRMPSFIGNNEGTAKKIYDDVYDEIDALPNLPKE